MDEKKKQNIYSICGIVATVALLGYIALTVAGSSAYLLAIRLIFTGIAAIAIAIRLVVEISSKDSWINSVVLIAICLYEIVVTAI